MCFLVTLLITQDIDVWTLKVEGFILLDMHNLLYFARHAQFIESSFTYRKGMNSNLSVTFQIHVISILF